MLNLKEDETIMKLSQKEHGQVTSLAFRSDYTDGMLVTGTANGDMVVWDLSKRSIHSFHRNIHPGGIGSLAFLDTLPLMVTSGVSDNAISVYIFDNPDGGCRLLKERRGFTSDLQFLLPYGEHDIIAAGGHEVGRLSMIQSHQNKVWSQSALEYQTAGQKSLMPWKFRNMAHLPPLVSIGYTGSSKMRHFDWPTIVTAHAGLPDAYVWSPHQQALVTRMLIIPRQATTGHRLPQLTAVAVSPCGNYAVIGCENGELHRFNLQSCYYRGLVGKLKSAPKKIEYISPRELVTADVDGIRKWKIVPRPEETTGLVTCATDIKTITVHGFMCAIAHESSVGVVSIVDMHADRKARTIKELAGSEITAISWSNGGRWLAIASADSRMIIYDVPTSQIVDKVKFTCPCTDIYFAKNNAQIVTCHRDGHGAIRVWLNVALLEGPGIVGPEPYAIDEDHHHPGEAPVEQESSSSNPLKKRQKISLIESDEIVLSAGSRTRWQQILKLDEIKERNKPNRPVEKPKSAPFFMPVMYKGVNPVFVASETPDATQGADDSVQIKEQIDMEESGFTKLVKSGDRNAIREHFINLTPSGVHICISELEMNDDAMNQFIGFLAEETESGKNLDLVATWTALFLNQFGSTIASRNSLFSSNLSQLTEATKKASLKFESKTNQLQCLVKVTAALQLHR